MEQLSADVTLQGRAVLGRHTFTSEMAVWNIAMEECPSGDAFSVFVEPMILFCHDAVFFLVVSWEKTTKAMEESGTLLVTDRKVVALYKLHHKFWLLEGRPVVAGKVLSA